jgi:general secretion pathway protein B
MSYILDALKKSEGQRRSRSEPVFHRGRQGTGGGRGWVLAAIGAVAVLAAVVTATSFRSGEAEREPDRREIGVPVVPGASVSAEKPAPPVPAVATPTPANSPAPTVAGARSSGNLSLGRATQVLDPESIPFLTAMPAEFQRDLPPLAVNIHVYSPDQSQCILYINNRQYHRGEVMENGVQVMDITPDGAVLQFLGQSFKLPRPS